MLGNRPNWKVSFLYSLLFTPLVSPNPLPNIDQGNKAIKNGPYALRLISTHPNLTNAYFTSDVSFKQNPDFAKIQPVWSGPSWLTRPNSTYDPSAGGSLFLDDRLDNYNSRQLTLQYAKGSDNHIPFLRWVWESGPGTTHVWPAYYYVSWGGFAFGKQIDSCTILFLDKGSNSVERGWKWAAQYDGLDSWSMRSFNATDPNISIPQNWEYVNIEAVAFEELVNQKTRSNMEILNHGLLQL
ncbi:hypothetical protein DM02DRAFT_650454 [Periconia macrospinosa]|uniref:Uncharacterized protein n=1 Tax=Periconia macrospinosa TaxID=97972 RepID=A0A2V1E6L8_9PLEO|nr:hypothetical protein DM02DRAFT_650454 [Periconia macrospinosa]